MKSGWFIMELYQIGNIGSNDIKKLDLNPRDGYSNYNEAKHAMIDYYNESEWELHKPFYSYAIMELFWS